MAATDKKKSTRAIVTIGKETHAYLKTLAAANNRSLGGQLDYLVKIAATAQMN